jgi:acyl-coenzyme A thioesterase PaaI-like protein
VTDLPPPGPTVPGRLGVTASVEDGALVFSLVPRPEHLHHGVVRASVHAYLVDALAGVSMDVGDTWALTTDLSVRAAAVPAPVAITARATVLRVGRRIGSATVDITTDAGELVGTGAAAFTTIERRATDPPKPNTTPKGTVARFAHRTRFLSEPLRQEAGIRSVDAPAGIVEVTVTRQLRNTNGTLQGAMVALVAEAAAEDLVQARFGVRAVVTDLDIRYLNRVEGGKVRSRCRLLGDRPDSPVEVYLHDVERDRTSTLVYARAAVLS